MVSVGSSRHAVECAIAIQRGIAEYSKQNPERKLKIRIGLNTGEVVEEAGDIFGAAVNVAARVASKAKGGEILVSEVVRNLVGPVAEMKFGYRGRYKLKGFPDRFRLHDVTAIAAPSQTAALPSGDGFVGREQERLDIRMTLDRAATGSGGMVFLAGPPGIGASRLASEVAAAAAWASSAPMGNPISTRRARSQQQRPASCAGAALSAWCWAGSRTATSRRWWRRWATRR